MIEVMFIDVEEFEVVEVILYSEVDSVLNVFNLDDKVDI